MAAHNTIETAILKDANADSPQDALDIARGILHWSVCTDDMVALLPGVTFLRDTLSNKGAVLTDIVLANLEPSVTKLTPTNQKAFKYAYQGVLTLLALRDFVSPPPQIDGGTLRQDYLINLGKYEDSRRASLIKMLNDSQIVPAKLKPVLYSPSGPQTSHVLLAASGVTSTLSDR